MSGDEDLPPSLAGRAGRATARAKRGVERHAAEHRDQVRAVAEIPNRWGLTVGAVVLAACLAVPAAGSWLAIATDAFSGADHPDGAADPVLGVIAVVLALVPFGVAIGIWRWRRRRRRSGAPTPTTSSTIQVAATVTFVLALASAVASAIVSLAT